MATGQWTADARNYQIAALAVLLILGMAQLDFDVRPFDAVLALCGTISAQLACHILWRLPKLELRSAIISGLSLSLLLRTNESVLFAAAGATAILSKFALRHDDKPIWNPAAFAIVIFRFGTNSAWISPGQWGTTIWFAALLAFLAIIVLERARRGDTALFFLGTHTALLFARAWWLGDPLAIPLHQLETGSLLLFAFFMVTDPRTTPDHRFGRFAFAGAVALLAHFLAFYEQIREAIYLSLFLLAPLVPLLDRALPTRRFAWTATASL
jgi:enediyne biosynthesis protein E5